MIHSRPVAASLYSRVPSNDAHSPRRRSSSSHPLSSVSLSRDGSHAAACGRDVLHVLRLRDDRENVPALEEVRSVRISQVSVKIIMRLVLLSRLSIS